MSQSKNEKNSPTEEEEDDEFLGFLSGILVQAEAMAMQQHPAVDSSGAAAATQKTDPELEMVRKFLADIRSGKVTPPRELEFGPNPWHPYGEKILVN